MEVLAKCLSNQVWKVEHKRSKHIFAMKEMLKTKIIDKRSEKSIKYERDILEKISHPFIVNMRAAFQDADNLYIVLDYLTGGDLRYQLGKVRRFSEQQIQFFVACIILALECIHSNNVLHRDLKPENFIIEESGYLRLTDFGIAKFQQKNNAAETSGTPGYMAPEVMCSQNHSFPVDFFALGVFTYEFIMGKRPYVGKSRREIKEHIMTRQAGIKFETLPDGFSENAADFANKVDF